ncbi:hypothetical protein [Microvirga flavescens]|uniref:hypothetical protein n=1 Tax=Microvirga flavescens TaxID=2249811 RepID=UPI000DDA5271|nr:hypothetical protein [Microvirga flavescens]
MKGIEIHGYAIVSDDDRIADESGAMPDLLRNDADWAYFQAELDLAALVVLGRLGHEANANPKKRARLVLSSSVPRLERREDGWWWNPATVSWEDAVRTVLPEGGRIAVPGGRRVFDLFLGIGYDAFHLTRAEGVHIPRGVALFSACDEGETAEEVLTKSGLTIGPRQVIDRNGPVSLTIWRRSAAAP